MSAEKPMERTCQRTCTDSNRSVQTPAPVSPTPGLSGVEHPGDGLGQLAFQGQPVVGMTPPGLSSLLSPDDAVPRGRYQPTAFHNVNQQQAPERPYEVVQRQIEQIHEVLQEQSRLLTLLGTDQMFPAFVPLRWISLQPVLISEKFPVFPVSPPPWPEDHPVSTCHSQDAFRSKEETADQRHLPTTTEADQTVDRDQDPVGPSANPADRECVEKQLKVHEVSEPKQLQNLSGMVRLTERRYFLREGEGDSKMYRNNLKVTDQQEAQRSASLGRQQLGGKLTSGIHSRSPSPSAIFKDEASQLETFQSLTFQPDHGREFGTPRDFCQTAECSQRRTPTEIHAPVQVCSREQTYCNTPLVPQPETPPVQLKRIPHIPATTGTEDKRGQSQERKSKENSCVKEKDDSDEETECRINQSLSEQTLSVRKPFREKRVKRQEMENVGETAGLIVDEDEVKSQFEFTAPHRKTAARAGVATSEDLWEQSLQQNNTHAWTPEHPSAAYESNSVHHFNIRPPMKDNRVSPRAWRNQEVIVSFKIMDDHMERVSSFNMETLSTCCDEKKTHSHLCQCSNSRAGSSTGSNWVKGQKQAATTTAEFCLDTCQVPTPLRSSTFPTHSTTRSITGGDGSGGDDENNPQSQCHQFPKLPFPPPCLGLQESHLYLPEADYGNESEKEQMFPKIQKQDQQKSSSSSSNRDDKTQGDSNGLREC
ncbi:uncharacterized protein LOC116391141 [Anarrhichthys ocellatus]|uniref:uncharacterized protein LOC116391141 n=1 Tax=Anarrhichthys ocellatus TaxID=433405 RepID=UPI0012EEC2AD|nr:uncharacterized protein LOC116391141 [Anarrhichthys ocellatus]